MHYNMIGLSAFVTLIYHSMLVASQPATHSRCRFALLYSQNETLEDSSAFESDIFYWEGQFHQTGVAYNSRNGMTYDGCLLDAKTGLVRINERHDFSAASKEALQIMVYTHAIRGDPQAARFVYPWSPSTAAEYAVAILATKLKTYQEFNISYPGYGGLLPWFLSNDTCIKPTSNWEGRVPALDNGELLWAIYALVGVLEKSDLNEYRQLGQKWQSWLDAVSRDITKMFYLGSGQVCAVANLDMSFCPHDVNQHYSCENGGMLDNPYEGELFTWWLYFFGGLAQEDRKQLWHAKRPQLVAVNYTGSVVNVSYSRRTPMNYTQSPVQSPSTATITVQQGFWFSSQEQWKLLQMPYLDVSIVRRVFKNAERVRTCNSVAMGQNAGMFASVSDVTDPATGQINGYISNAGVPSVASHKEQRLDVITPYSVFPTILFDRKVGLAWYKNMLDAKGAQNPYGSSESLRRDGTGISAFVSWDSKITTVVALLGGMGSTVADRMRDQGIYDEFVDVLDREYNLVFGEGSGNVLVGEDVELCLPNVAVPVRNVTDFSMCS